MEGSKYRIVTNNEWIKDDASLPQDIVFADGTPIDVLDKAEELLQQGWKLVSAPLPPNVPIMRGPYRSLVLEKNDRLYDRDGILEIEKARTRYSFEQKDRKPPRPSKDFGVIDREMLIRMLRDAALVKAEGKNV